MGTDRYGGKSSSLVGRWLSKWLVLLSFKISETDFVEQTSL
jgi:hypothetical protein